MSKISNELREHGNYSGLIDGADKWLLAAADRIDNEMIELPKDANDEHFHKGDIVYGKNGTRWTVKGLGYHDWQPTDTNEYIPEVTIDVYRMDADACFVGLNNRPVEEYSHRHPDSLKRIASEMKVMNRDTFRQGFMIASHDTVAEWVDRINKLADKYEQ